MRISSPTENHALTLVALHGFNSSALEFEEKIKNLLPRSVYNRIRVLYPCAPRRKITCYNQGYSNAWHDYFTNYGDHGTEKEEEIDEAQLTESSTRIQNIILAERERCPHVFLIGESQGACLAIDVALRLNVPTIALYGQRYSASPTNEFNPPIFSLHGTRDTVIPSSVAISSMAQLSNVRIRIVRGYTHAHDGPAVAKFFKESLTTLEHALHRPPSPR